ncbi:hypothetical protein TNCV_3814761 [Trichonephila clavipes]|nr:hypothetical protein TNCV_3814761 [Trichonephila clavipes]
MFRSDGQSDAKPTVLNSDASLVLIYRPTEGMKGRVHLAQPEIAPFLLKLTSYGTVGRNFRYVLPATVSDELK